ncbi:pre-60S factor REI1, putative [Cordyceps militaris CM01]|uniref:Pre-60S factor REI1, putative n=1 Tax=Cordyceps militaris (strain CM01) TaxID=983644 RepID=G3JUM7_CORMM|nr:pre-60S factor REI1, putative [Cordyceps militaris CM01]EGX87763.1 pre-60S factor REI1, putative [Cordyceps militaris CM01]
MTGTTGTCSTCSTCSLTFDTVGAFRVHAKSPEHVANLRRRAAQSGAEIRTASDSDSDSAALSGAEIHSASDSDSDSSLSYPPSSDSDSDAEPSRCIAHPGFVAEQCLFCDVQSADLDANLIHMASTHSFVVPYQAELAVELETLVWYLQLVIYTYHECIACGSRRRSAAAAQQHMQSKGHCHFDMANPEMREFYDVSALDARLVSGLAGPDEGTMQLASGKLIAQRGADGAPSGAGNGGTRRKRLERGQLKEAETALAIRGSDEQRQVMLDGANMGLTKKAARQMAQLSVRDQQALAHLPPREQRRELARYRKQANQALRANWQQLSRLGRNGNKTLMKNYKAQGPGRRNG